MIRIFVGCSANAEDAEAQAMLEYSLRHYASEPIDITWMMLSRDKDSPWYSSASAGWNTQLWATPFSVFRWAIPHVCNYHGRAIYMDVDMVARADIAQLWNQPIPKALLWKDPKNSCVMLFDCAKMKNVLPPFEHMRRKLGGYSVYRDNHAKPHATLFNGNWNCLDGEAYKTLDDPDIKVIHFTKVETQPHLKWALPRLKKSKVHHWNEHTLRAFEAHPHPHPGVRPLVDKLWEETLTAGYRAEMYVPQESEMFGQYNAVRGGQRAA